MEARAHLAGRNGIAGVSEIKELVASIEVSSKVYMHHFFVLVLSIVLFFSPSILSAGELYDLRPYLSFEIAM